MWLVQRLTWIKMIMCNDDLKKALVECEETFKIIGETRKNIDSLFWNFFIKWKTAVTIEEENEARRQYDELTYYCNKTLGIPLPEWFTNTSTYKDDLCQ